MTQKSMLIKNRSKGIKLLIKYNLDGIFIGESVVHLTSYLGVLACTMVPITYKTWHVIPKELKDKLWDCIEVTTLALCKTSIIPNHMKLLISMILMCRLLFH